MTPNLDQVAKELYGKIQTRFPDIKIADEEAMVLGKKSDIPKARFFEFEYKEGGEELGAIAIALDEDDGIVIQVSGDLIDKDTNETHHGAYKFIRSFRDFAKRNLLNFEINNLGKSSLDKRDYEFHAKDGEEKMMESKMFGTAKVSYQDLGETRMIVKHSQPVNLDLPAGRTMHIDAIYIENAQGERFRYPMRHLNGARAMAQHIAHGGNPYDQIGQHVISLSEEMAKLRMFKNYVGRNETLSEAMSEVNSKVAERIEEVKKEIHNLQRSSYYTEFAESFKPRANQQIPETVVNDWIDRLTVRSFKEELKDVFPYIYSLVGEKTDLGPEDVLAEKRTEEKNEKGEVVKWKEETPWRKASNKDGRGRVTNLSDKARRETEKMTKEASEFVDYINSIAEDVDGDVEQDLPHLDDTEFKEKLKDLMSEPLVGTPNIVDSVKAIYPDETLLTMMNNAMTRNDKFDARGTIAEYFENHHSGWYHSNEDLFASAGSDEDKEPEETPAPEPEATPAPAPEAPAEAPAPEAGAEAAAGGVPPVAPPAPVAESKIKSLIQRAIQAGASADTVIGNKTLGEMIASAGLTLAEFDMGGDIPVAEPTQPQGQGVEDMMKFISGFWNREKRNFTIGGTGVKTKLEKQFSEASPHDLQRVSEFIQKLDPSSPLAQKDRVLKLAGIKPKMDTDEAIRVMESYLG